MNFASLENLYLLIPLTMVVLFAFRAISQRRGILEKFCESKLFDSMVFYSSRKFYRTKTILLTFGLVFIFFALLQPRYGFRWKEVRRHGLDLMIAMDVSKSMLAEDVKPSRLERAKHEIRDLLKVVQGDRVGLVAFSGNAFVHSPLTLDYSALKLFIDELSPASISMGGTAIGEAILLSMKAFEKKSRKSKAIILITDGEDQSGKLQEALSLAKEKGVRVFTMGVGDPGGAPIPDPVKGGFKKDPSGNMVLSKVNEQSLKRIASETGGSYVRSVSGGEDTENLNSDLRSDLEESEFEGGRRKVWIERFQWPLFFAFLILFAESFLAASRVAVILLPFFLFSPQLSAGVFSEEGINEYKKGEYSIALEKLKKSSVKDPDNLRKRYNLGNTFYRLKQFDKAEKMFSASSMSDERLLKRDSYHNLGNAYFEQGKFQEAAGAYTKALEIDKESIDTKHNLELAQKKLEQKKQNKENQKDSQNKDSKDKESQDKNRKDKNLENDSNQENQQSKNDQNKEQNSENRSDENIKSEENKKPQEAKNKSQENKESQHAKNQQESNKTDESQKESEENLKSKKEMQEAMAGDEKQKENQNLAKEDESEQGSSSGDQKMKQIRSLTPSQAKRWLDMVKENKRKYLNRSMKGDSNNGRDW